MFKMLPLFISLSISENGTVSYCCRYLMMKLKASRLQVKVISMPSSSVTPSITGLKCSICYNVHCLSKRMTWSPYFPCLISTLTFWKSKGYLACLVVFSGYAFCSAAFFSSSLASSCWAFCCINSSTIELLRSGSWDLSRFILFLSFSIWWINGSCL